MCTPTGQIVTFFSYKGGVGQSMALANVAVQLAKVVILGNGGVVDIISSGLSTPSRFRRVFTVKADPGLMATIDVPSQGNGVTVNAPSAMVTVRNLTLNGNGGTGHGFQINCVGRIVVEDCDSRNF